MNDFKKALSIQKLIVNSNSARLISIRNVTQVSLNRKLPGIDGKLSINFIDRFELNELLKLKALNWTPQLYKTTYIIMPDGSLKLTKIFTIADRVWQTLIKLVIEPAHEAVFNPLNFGFRLNYNLYDFKKYFFLILDKNSYGFQKRFIIIDFKESIEFCNENYLLKNLISPRGIKFGVFRFLKFGFKPFFTEDAFNLSDFSSLLANILLHGIETIHFSVRFGFKVIFFLKPLHDESTVFRKILGFLQVISFKFNCNDFYMASLYESFDFLYWNFRLNKRNQLLCSPSNGSYQKFLKRVKQIINNSNYGAGRLF